MQGGGQPPSHANRSIAACPRSQAAGSVYRVTGPYNTRCCAAGSFLPACCRRPGPARMSLSIRLRASRYEGVTTTAAGTSESLRSRAQRRIADSMRGQLRNPDSELRARTRTPAGSANRTNHQTTFSDYLRCTDSGATAWASSASPILPTVRLRSAARCEIRTRLDACGYCRLIASKNSEFIFVALSRSRRNSMAPTSSIGASSLRRIQAF